MTTVGEPMTEPPPTRLEQLQRALDAGLIDQDTFDAAVAGMTAQVAGGGAIAQGQGATAVGAGGVGVQGDNTGTINLGVLIQQGARRGASREDLTRAYLARILTQANQLPLFVGDSANAQVRLSAVYTALLTQRSETDAATGDALRGVRESPDRTGQKALRPRRAQRRNQARAPRRAGQRQEHLRQFRRAVHGGRAAGGPRPEPGDTDRAVAQGGGRRARSETPTLGARPSAAGAGGAARPRQPACRRRARRSTRKPCGASSAGA